MVFSRCDAQREKHFRIRKYPEESLLLDSYEEIPLKNTIGYTMRFDKKSDPPLGRCSGFWKVDMQLLPVKVHYFLFMGALGCVLPFRTVFAKQLGISATAVGVIFLAVPFMKILTNPMCGIIGDYFKKFRLIIAVLVAIVAVTHLAMIYIPPLPTSAEGHESLANNIRVHAEYDSSSSSSLYLHVFTESQSNYLIEPVDFSCEVSCNSSLSIPKTEKVDSHKKMTCKNYPNILASFDFRTNACQLDFRFANESAFFIHNSTRDIVKVSEKESEQYRKGAIGFSLEQNCSSSEIPISGSSDNILSPDERIILNATNSNVDSEFVDGIIGRRKVFLINERNSLIKCQNEAKLFCIVQQCKYNNDTPIVTMEQEDEFLSGQFWALFLLISVSSTSFCAVLFLIDAVCYEMLQHKKANYGNQRLWGTIGWGLGSLAGGYLNQVISDGSSYIDYSLSFYLLVVLMIVDLIPVSLLKVEEVKYSSNICRDVFLLLTKPDIAINIFIVFVVGVLSGLVWNYQFWFMEEIGASQVLLGLSQLSECLFAELPCFMIASWVIKKIGYINCNSLTLLCFGLRYLCLAYMYDPWMTLPVGLFNGPSFGIFFAAITMYGKNEAPPGTEATVQALLSMAFEGIGCGTGSILGGIGFDKFGSRKTFLYSAITSFVFLVVNVILHVFYFRRKTNLRKY